MTRIVEEYSFLIQDFHMEHASTQAVLDIRIRYQYIAGIAPTAYPDFREITEAIKAYLTDYPNKDEYWEMINKELEMPPPTRDPDFNSSKVTCQREPARTNRLSNNSKQQPQGENNEKSEQKLNI